ncbi:MAG: glycosyltransferase [Pirellulales bacterium]
MHVLYVHQNYPAQFGHIAAYLVKHHKFRCTFVTERASCAADGVQQIQYKVRGGATAKTHFCSRGIENFTWRSHAVYETMKAHPEIRPDIVVGHSGFGSTLFLADLYDCPIVNFFEWYYRTDESDGEFLNQVGPANAMRSRIRNAMLLADLQASTLGYSPTNWQRSRFPHEYQPKLETIFDGIDTDFWRRQALPEGAPLKVAGREIPRDMKIVTYVSRGFEMMRGFDVFLKIAHRICRLRRDVLFLCVGSDRCCYGSDGQRIKAKSLREHLLAQGEYDLERILFLGIVPPAKLVKVLSASDLHVYLTAPFVLSWSLMDALACGCTVLAADTAPLREVIEHGRNGLMSAYHDVDHFVELALEVLDDPKAFRCLGEAGVETIDARYSLAKVMPRMLDLYNRAMAIKKGRARGAQADSEPRAIGVVAEKGLEALARRHPWPAHKPAPLAPSRDGWLSATQRAVLARVLGQDTRLIVELGAWRGQTTEFLAKQCPQAVVVAVDHWPGCAQLKDHPEWKAALPDVFQSFAARCSPWAERIIPMRMTLPEAIEELYAHRLQPDAVYIDSGYSFDLASSTIAAAHRRFPRAVLVGDDWQWWGVRKTVLELVASSALELEVNGNTWRAWRREGESSQSGEGNTTGQPQFQETP